MRSEEPKLGCSDAIIVSVIAREAAVKRSLVVRLKVTPDLPHSPVQLQPRAVVP